MTINKFVFEDFLNRLDVIVHKKFSSGIEIVVETYKKYNSIKGELCDLELCVTVADSEIECDELLIDYESHTLFSETFSLSVVGCNVIVNLNEGDDRRYNICCVYGDNGNLVEKFNELVEHLISIGFPISRVREADE